MHSIPHSEELTNERRHEHKREETPGKGPDNLVQDHQRQASGRARHLVRPLQGRNAGHSRRVRIRKERHQQDHPRNLGRKHHHRERRDPLRRQGPPEDQRGRLPRDPRRQDLHDLPGSSFKPQPGHEDRKPDHRGHAPEEQGQQAREPQEAQRHSEETRPGDEGNKEQ